jgi:hypothetical integral membrane protein (TIGR02206 family)
MFGDFKIFGATHLAVLGLLLIGVLYIWFILPKLSSSFQNLNRNIILVGLVLQFILFHAWHLYFHDYDITRFLPFHLCTISVVLLVYTLAFNNKFINKLVLFWSPVSALLAIVLPDMSASENFPSFRFMEFFGSHVLIIWAVVFIFRIQKVTVDFKDYLFSEMTLLASLPFVYILNLLIGSNYMYLMRKTNGGQMDFLPKEPWHIVGASALLIGVFFLEYLIYKILKPNDLTRLQK